MDRWRRQVRGKKKTGRSLRCGRRKPVSEETEAYFLLASYSWPNNTHLLPSNFDSCSCCTG